jgi:protein-S-isoprenylcysteine O-methyltransferase Ste14
MTVFFALFMFVPAGTWRWARGWLLVAVFVISGLLATLYLWRVNPEIVAARVNRHQGTKRWDKILLAFFFPAFMAIFPVAALDDGRFHWSRVPWSVCLLGYLIFAAGMVLMTWAEAVNKFFEPTVRIQAERGPTVVDSGPYAIIRHPGYVAGSLLFIGIALALGSLWALIPVGVSCLLLVLRTHWEDQMLQAEMPGYADYAARVAQAPCHCCVPYRPAATEGLENALDRQDNCQRPYLRANSQERCDSLLLSRHKSDARSRIPRHPAQRRYLLRLREGIHPLDGRRFLDRNQRGENQIQGRP